MLEVILFFIFSLFNLYVAFGLCPIIFIDFCEIFVIKYHIKDNVISEFENQIKTNLIVDDHYLLKLRELNKSRRHKHMLKVLQNSMYSFVFFYMGYSFSYIISGLILSWGGINPVSIFALSNGFPHLIGLVVAYRMALQLKTLHEQHWLKS